MKLQTKRLILRPFQESDKADLVRQINNLHIAKWLLVVPHPYTMKDANWWINHCDENEKEKPKKSYNLALTLKGEDRLIGAVGLAKVDREQGTGELGYWLAEDHWRNGYMSESVTRMIGYAFNTLKLRRLNIPAFAKNPASNGLAKSLGFSYEGCLKQAVVCKATGKIHDENLWGLLRKDWRKRK
jgi:[ribosomal protein S5]-alanine N-acetyltransferase